MCRLVPALLISRYLTHEVARWPPMKRLTAILEVSGYFAH
jgi:hypothetical protein